MKYHPADPAIPVLNPDENSLSHPPPKKSQEIIPESAPELIVVYENGQGEKDLPVPTQKRRLIIDTYSAQCNKCQKWRIIPTKRKYEEIREKLRSGPFSCEHASEWRPGVTCDDPTDASQDDGKFWAIDKPGIARTPLGWDRTISIRSEGSTRFADVYYTTPTGKVLRSKVDVGRYLKENPQCAAAIEQFSFATPVPLQWEYIKKRPRQSKPLQLEEGSTFGMTFKGSC
ncbi:methyl-CpG-binding domain-containing protein 2 isoform X2 [Brachypodium distachyon]|uniref:MBD domain-containing protein n=1 Tax=Brachypodium distachyon TaxID=15368 RepID=A0A0Q3FHW7_BRADI|nr:methyl-CpG-binding domain-containing protein 2 isoform X2 [Brachypodium distachyon]KQJ98806.1 hypothetical protein BRADI_3g39250v3 [Brachypodium distachyon]|eukprot:XP_024317711.1 methyl-CpG-binding domain-containing protein 2 isoform X2 [Brachypodium distachyon]